MMERQVRKVQKERHMSEIMSSLDANSIFKNLSYRDKRKLCKLIYKAELIETHIRGKQVIRINQSFQEIITNAMMQMDLEDLENFDDDEDYPENDRD